MLALAASVGFAVGSVVMKQLNPGPDLLSITAWQLLLGGTGLLAAGLIVERNDPIDWDPRFVGLLVFLALPGTALLSALWYWLVQRGDLGRLATFFFLVPVFGLAAAAIVLGERITPVQVAGAAAILASVACVLRDA